MSENTLWYKLLNLARSSAAEDLHLSNEILDLVEKLDQLNSDKGLPKEDISKLSNDLIKQSIRLADKSKDINYVIAKLTGTI